MRSKQFFANTYKTWSQHQFLVMIIGVIVIAGIFVAIAMDIYNTSGAAQVDLSRPGFKEVRKQASHDTTPVVYPSDGAITKQSLNDFKKLYQDHQKKITDDSFNPSVLSDESLQLFSNTDNDSTGSAGTESSTAE